MGKQASDSGLGVLTAGEKRLIALESLQWCAVNAVYFLGLIGAATYELGGNAFLVAAITLVRNLCNSLANAASGPVIDRIGPRKTALATLYAMLAMIAVDRGDRALNAGASDKAAEHYRSAELLLPKLTELSTKPDDAYFELIIRGRLAQSQAIQADELLADSGRRHWMDARSFYKRAYDLRPRIRNRMLEFILNIDRRLGDKAQAEKDALEILIDEPSNPYANFVIGTQRLEDGNFREARLYFAQAYNALGQGSDLSLINNYAEALTRSDDPADHALAERIIKEPTFQHPGNHLLRATYALTLARNGKVAEAQETLRQARDIAEKLGIVIDPRIAFVEAWIAASQKNADEVDRILRTLRTALGPDATPRDRHDFRAIREAAKQ